MQEHDAGRERRLQIETIAVHGGHAVDPTTAAVTSPIHLSTTFEREPDGSYRSPFIYSRSNNPNRDALERGIAALEGGAQAAAFGSASAAASAIFQALSPGDHVVMPSDVYHGTTKLVRDLFMRWGIAASFVDMTNFAETGNAFRRETKLIWIETPSNPLLKIVDIAAVAERAHSAGAICVCDNSLAPILQRPLELGADLVTYAATKYIGGHSDVTSGIVVAKTESDFFARVREIQGMGGAVPSPFDCWLVLRGMRTLPWRIRAHSENAMKLATFLESHPAIGRVYYPGLASHVGHELAARQMSAFSGMLSIEVKGGREAALAAAARTRLFFRGTSFGGVESLIEHRASIKGEDPRTPQSLLRLSVGLENADDLIADLTQALD